MADNRTIRRNSGERNLAVRMLRRLPALMGSVMVIAMVLSGLPGHHGAKAQTGPVFNYGEALQKAIWFYEAQVSGPKPSTNRVTWRADSAMNDGSDVGHDLTGGWYDAGDHIKFGFAMASSVTMLAWGAVENRQAYSDSFQLQFLLNNLRVANDYFIKAHTAPNELYGQVGAQGPDHSFWGPAEITQEVRPSFKIDMTHPGSDLAAETAAAMAASSIVFRPTDPTYADTLLSHARQLFAFAQATAGTFYVDAITDAQCCYNSHFGSPNDEIAWAAVWLFKATSEATFLTAARQIYPTMCTDPSGVPCFNWTQNWDDKEFGVYVLMAELTGEAQFKTDAQRWLDFWSVGAGTRTPGGLMFVNGFGSLRYATNTAFIMLVYADFLGTSDPLYSRYHDFAKKQIDYVLGANPANHSYMGGFGNNPPINEHHRNGHGSWANGGPSGPPTNNRHVLYGAMVGGPTSASDTAWADDRTNFQENEPATDYNAGLVGALARLFKEFGGTPLPNFPPIETPDGDEIFISAGINASGSNFTEIKALVTNMSAWPPRMVDKGTFRYFFTLEPGVSPSQITLNQNFTQCTGGITGPIQWSGNVYYVQINCIGTQIYPGGQSVFQREVQFRMTSSGAWDPTNDYSFQDIAGVLNGQTVKTNRIVLYSNGTKIWGNEPPIGSGPFVSLTSPSNGATFTAPATIPLAATASDSTATITRVDFFNGATLLGTDTTAPFTFTLSGATAATYSLTAKATDSAGATATSAPVSVTVNPPADIPPTVSITSPASGASFSAPASVAISASAADSDGTVTRVDFFSGATLVGGSTTAPFTFTLPNLA
ncbi:MAG TPA: glycoside hydrolase family 9 protein, partial [Blastocatellia bacterium]|nr:glycoside hydrolase family 9 protein [Blastocatellia bacterium]